MTKKRGGWNLSARSTVFLLLTVTLVGTSFWAVNRVRVGADFTDFTPIYDTPDFLGQPDTTPTNPNPDSTLYFPGPVPTEEGTSPIPPTTPTNTPTSSPSNTAPTVQNPSGGTPSTAATNTPSTTDTSAPVIYPVKQLRDAGINEIQITTLVTSNLTNPLVDPNAPSNIEAATFDLITGFASVKFKDGSLAIIDQSGTLLLTTDTNKIQDKKQYRSDGTYEQTITYPNGTSKFLDSATGVETWRPSSDDATKIGVTADEQKKLANGQGISLSPERVSKLNLSPPGKVGGGAPGGESKTVLAGDVGTFFTNFTGKGTGGNLGLYIKTLYNWALVIGAGLAVIMIMFSGYVYITSAGDPEGIRSAKDYLIGALVGLGVLILTATILNTLSVRGTSSPAASPTATPTKTVSLGLPDASGNGTNTQVAQDDTSCSLQGPLVIRATNWLVTNALGIGTAYAADDDSDAGFSGGASGSLGIHNYIQTIVADKEKKTITAYRGDGTVIFSKPANFGYAGASEGKAPYSGDHTTPVTAVVRDGRVIPVAKDSQGNSVEYFTFDGKLRSTPASDGCLFPALVSEIPTKNQGQFYPGELVTIDGKQYYNYKIAMRGFDSGGNSMVDRAVLFHAGRDPVDLATTQGCIRVSPYVLHVIVLQSAPTTRVIIVDKSLPAAYSLKSKLPEI